MVTKLKTNNVDVYYPESDWQLLKQLLNIWFDFADYRELPFRFSRSKLAFNIAGLINQGKADIQDLKVFSKKLQLAVGALLGDFSIMEEVTGLKYEGGDEE